MRVVVVVVVVVIVVWKILGDVRIIPFLISYSIVVEDASCISRALK
jgi:hypothetical protein